MCLLPPKIRATKTACCSVPPSPNSEPTTKSRKRARWLSSAFRKGSSSLVCLCAAGLLLHSSAELDQIVYSKVEKMKPYEHVQCNTAKRNFKNKAAISSCRFLFPPSHKNSQRRNQSQGCRYDAAFQISKMMPQKAPRNASMEKNENSTFKQNRPKLARAHR